MQLPPSSWLQLIREQGPGVGTLLLLLYWQSRQNRKLLEKHSDIYEREIAMLVDVHDKLLDHILGTRSTSVPMHVMQPVETIERKPRKSSPGD